MLIKKIRELTWLVVDQHHERSDHIATPCKGQINKGWSFQMITRVGHMYILYIIYIIHA